MSLAGTEIQRAQRAARYARFVVLVWCCLTPLFWGYTNFQALGIPVAAFAAIVIPNALEAALSMVGLVLLFLRPTNLSWYLVGAGILIGAAVLALGSATADGVFVNACLLSAVGVWGAVRRQ